MSESLRYVTRRSLKLEKKPVSLLTYACSACLLAHTRRHRHYIKPREREREKVKGEGEGGREGGEMEREGGRTLGRGRLKTLMITISPLRSLNALLLSCCSACGAELWSAVLRISRFGYHDFLVNSSHSKLLFSASHHSSWTQPLGLSLLDSASWTQSHTISQPYTHQCCVSMLT